MRASRALIAGLLLLCCQMAGAAAGVGELAATILFASGASRLIAVDGAERPAVQGGELRSGESVDTGDGRVQLKFRDGASMSLQPATRFRVDDYAFAGEQGKASSGDRGFFSLLRGGFRTLTGLIGKATREQYRVDTTVATIGIRGTAYTASLDDGALSVRTHAGQVSVCNQSGCVEVVAGELATVRRFDEKPRLQSLTETMKGAGLPTLAPPVSRPEVPTQSPAVNASPVPATAPPAWQTGSPQSPVAGPGHY